MIQLLHSPENNAIRTLLHKIKYEWNTYDSFADREMQSVQPIA